MRWLDKRCVIATLILFVLPVFVYPVRGSIGHSITTYTYGFPFSWFSIHFTARGGRLFLWHALAVPNQGIEIDFITAILNLIILYIIVRAIINVFGKKKQKYQQQKQSKKESEEKDS